MICPLTNIEIKKCKVTTCMYWSSDLCIYGQNILDYKLAKLKYETVVSLSAKRARAINDIKKIIVLYQYYNYLKTQPLLPIPKNSKYTSTFKSLLNVFPFTYDKWDLCTLVTATSYKKYNNFLNKYNSNSKLKLQNIFFIGKGKLQELIEDKQLIKGETYEYD